MTISQTQIETPDTNTINLNEKKYKIRESNSGEIKNSSITIPKLNFNKIKLEQEKHKLHKFHKFHSINFDGKLYFEDNNINNSNEHKKKKKKRHHKYHKSHKLFENLKLEINDFSDFEINQELNTNYFIE